MLQININRSIILLLLVSPVLSKCVPNTRRLFVLLKSIYSELNGKPIIVQGVISTFSKNYC